MTCELCTKLFSPKEADEWKNDDGDYEGILQYSIIVKYKNNRFGLSHRTDDPYYTGHYLDINFCPICGRKL